MKEKHVNVKVLESAWRKLKAEAKRRKIGFHEYVIALLEREAARLDKRVKASQSVNAVDVSLTAVSTPDEARPS